MNNPKNFNNPEYKNPEVNQGVNPEQLKANPEVIEKPMADKITDIDNQLKIDKEKIEGLSASITDTENKLSALRESLGIQQQNEKPHSVIAGNDQIEGIKKQISEHEKERDTLYNQKAELIVTEEQNGMDKGQQEESKLEKSAADLEKEKKIEGKEEKKEKISEDVLAKLSEAVQKKRALELKVGEMKETSEFKQYEEDSKNLDEKRKKLEELKKPRISGNINISINNSGSFSSEGTTINFNSASSQEKGIESANKKEEIDLQKEAEKFLEKTKFEILKLEKEEMENSPEALKIKTGKMNIETKRVEAETEIWSSGKMDQETFDKNLKAINKTEGESEEIENKELFNKLRDLDKEFIDYNNDEKNIGYNKSIEDKQKEIDIEKDNIDKLDFTNQDEILKDLDKYNKENGKNGELEKPTPEEIEKREKSAEEEMTDEQKKMAPEREAEYEKELKRRAEEAGGGNKE